MMSTASFRTMTDYTRKMEYIAIDYASTAPTTSYLIIGMHKTNSK